MTSTPENPYYGPLPPPPIMELTFEQEFRYKQLELALNNPDVRAEDIKTLFLAVTKQNYCLTNTIKNLLKEWPSHPPTIAGGMLKYGISLETND